MNSNNKITGADIFEALFAITKDDMPTGLTDDMMQKLADRLNEAFSSGRMVRFDYKNHRAETELRTIKVLSLDFLPLPNNSMGYPPGWALRGLDYSRDRDGTEMRSFLLNNIQMPEVIFRQPQNNNPFRIMLK